MTEPRRLLDDPEAPQELRNDLGRASEHAVDYDVAAGAARFEQFLASPQAAAPPDVASTATTAATGKAGTAIVVGLVAAGGAGLLAWALSRPPAPTPSPSEPAPMVVVEQETAPAPAPVIPEEKRVEPPPPEEPAPAPEATLRPEAKRPRPKLPTKVAPEGPDRLQAEMAATQAAKRALSSNPGRALKLAREAEREFKGGYFSEDRKAIIVLALFGLDRDDEAIKKAESFLSAHGKSTFADRIRAELKSRQK